MTILSNALERSSQSASLISFRLFAPTLTWDLKFHSTAQYCAPGVKRNPALSMSSAQKQTNYRHSPIAPITQSASSQRLRSCVTSIKRMWFAMQISQRGRYSIEKMLAFQEYAQTISVARILVVSIATPLPMVILVLATEMIPLQNPSDGWRANYGIWIRTAVQAGVIALTAAGQAAYFLCDIQFSVCQLVCLFLCVSVGYTVVAMVVAALIGFPIPFMAISMSPVFFTVLGMSLWATVGKSTIQNVLKQRKQFLRFAGFLCAQLSVLLVYPFYQILFNNSTDTAYELSAFLLLPVLKIGLKNLVSFSVAHVEDMVPEAVIFTVNFFNAMYLATCMRSATSAVTVSIVIAVDVAQTALTIRDLFHRIESIQVRLHSSSLPADLMGAAIHLCKTPSLFQQQKRSHIHTRSCLPYSLSSHSQLLSSLPTQDRQSMLLTTSDLNPTLLSPFFSKLKTFFSASVHPVPVLNEPSSLLSDLLRVLFTTECLVLAEYLEATIPALYAFYLMIMVRLPNAQFHSELQGLDVTNVQAQVAPILLYAALELFSLALLVGLLRYKGGMQTLQQLTFALEKQAPLVQGKLLLWMLMAMGFRIAHFGADFSFRFNWLSV